MPVDAKPLFRPDALRPHLVAFPWPVNIEEIRHTVGKWAEMFRSQRADQFKEKELLPRFLTDIFCTVLGYTEPADVAERFTFSRERHVEVDGKFADAVLGHFRPDGFTSVVALEGKGPLDPLDRPFAGRKKSAVDQGYGYAINLQCDWIIVTSMKQTRLYYKGTDQSTYERFDTIQLATDDALLKRFLFLLGAERVTPATGANHLHALFTASEKAGKELTKKFYFEYAEMRQTAFEHLCQENPQVSQGELLTATQKLLDRILFCAFCEDRGLLPAHTIKDAYEYRDRYHPKSIWENFQGLFRAIDTGNTNLNIPAYNGGLFAKDPVLDTLQLTDEVCHHFLELGEYDYRPPSIVSPEDETGGKLVDVDILGHIFEQSITDLERLRNELDGKVEPLARDKLKTRRKKEGAFYTPAFITRYIVEQALGSVLRDRFEAFRAARHAKAKGTAKTALADPNVYDLAQLKDPQRKALIEFWEAWQDELAKVRILDPACGSGAFLIEAFDQLHTVYDETNERLQELRGSRSLFDPDTRILQSNLYGVDLNEEAIEICRLSLWIKTAARGKKLTSLDHTIRVGNSVVSDPAVHPRAFDWQAAFPEVFKAGGFDVIIGNPPYIRQEWLAPYKSYWKEKFESYDGVADIFTYFFEAGVKLLRDGGRLGYITSGSWVRGNYGAPLRQFISSSVSIESMIDFGEFQPFEDAEMIRPTIAILRKHRPGGRMKLFKWLTSGTPPENLSEVMAVASTMRTDHLNAEAWQLETDEVIALQSKLTSGGNPLSTVISSPILRGILSGLTEAFVINASTREQLIQENSRSAELIKPFAQGTNLRPWHFESTEQFLIAIPSSANHEWPWSKAETEVSAEEIFRQTYPAIHCHLFSFNGAATQRQDKGHFWWELRACGYWDAFDQPKIAWPDISKLPRFSLDTQQYCLGNTGYFIPTGDLYLLGVLSSWATWFFISKTAQPLRLRGDRWQYRLFTQYMEHIPIPDATKSDRATIAALAKRCTTLGPERYELETQVQRRLAQVFSGQGDPSGTLNNKAQEWWLQSLNELGNALKTSFKLKANPFSNPRTADEWESYLAEKRGEVERLTCELAEAEAEINARVYKLFHLTPTEIALLEREVEH